LTELVSLAARLLDRHFEAEIVELHHHGKKDAPSGTALALGRAVAAARGLDFDEEARLAREGIVGARPQEEIGIVALRAGDAVGDHTVIFGGQGERLQLVHRAPSRDGPARGALRGGRRGAGAPAGAARRVPRVGAAARRPLLDARRPGSLSARAGLSDAAPDRSDDFP